MNRYFPHRLEQSFDMLESVQSEIRGFFCMSNGLLEHFVQLIERSVNPAFIVKVHLSCSHIWTGSGNPAR